ncbi:uncharacterized protein A4U43_C07F4180 [Asparagus officinalis]|uniref:Uncharacterized protein n=1 Tax=Asparagus officinalis TaxID=4686 RepID=A0A5P1EB90_ASPOF|nr:uncharacterized protein A4U43_C07F4180 [Asparagus officinalis]
MNDDDDDDNMNSIDLDDKKVLRRNCYADRRINSNMRFDDSDGLDSDEEIDRHPPPNRSRKIPSKLVVDRGQSQKAREIDATLAVVNGGGNSGGDGSDKVGELMDKIIRE